MLIQHLLRLLWPRMPLPACDASGVYRPGVRQLTVAGGRSTPLAVKRPFVATTKGFGATPSLRASELPQIKSGVFFEFGGSEARSVLRTAPGQHTGPNIKFGGSEARSGSELPLASPRVRTSSSEARRLGVAPNCPWPAGSNTQLAAPGAEQKKKEGTQRNQTKMDTSGAKVQLTLASEWSI